jgi:hypothetical protein
MTAGCGGAFARVFAHGAVPTLDIALHEPAMTAVTCTRLAAMQNVPRRFIAQRDAHAAIVRAQPLRGRRRSNRWTASRGRHDDGCAAAVVLPFLSRDTP